LNDPGTIGSHAMINVTANNVSTGTLDAGIDNSRGGTIGGMALLFFDLSGNLTTTSGAASFRIDNRRNGISGGSINGDAIIDIGLGGNISAQGLGVFQIFNDNAGSGNGGTIFSNAIINVNAANIICTGGTLNATIANGAGTIDGNATINVTAGSITANSLVAQFNNSNGTIMGNAAINMNVSNTVPTTITNGATFQIFGSDGANTAAINLNGGNYNVGGTFLSQIDGNGMITFNNVGASAAVFKAGVFGANGVLNVGGGMLSANTELKLYAPGSNGQLKFVSDVTLGGNSVKSLAANSVTIDNGVVVTIAGPKANVYVNFVLGVPNANYHGFGGNDHTTGTFAGSGANPPQILSNAPIFGPVSPAPIATRPRIHPRPPVTTGVINVSSSDDLLSLLDDVHPGRDGRIRIPASNSTNNSRHSSRVDPAGRLNPVSRSNVDRRAMDLRTASSSVIRRSPQ